MARLELGKGEISYLHRLIDVHSGVFKKKKTKETQPKI